VALNMTISATSGVAATVVDDETAADLTEAYEALKAMPVSNQVNVDFPDTKSAKEFARMGRAWALAQTPPLTFARMGDVKALPNRVSFRIYTSSPRGPLTEAQKTQRAATRAANKASKAAGK